MVKSNDIIQFWFEEIEPKNWWIKDEAFDAMIRDRFLSTHQQAMQGELYQWRTTPLGRLAEIIVLDQFSRNMFRGEPESFASDALALCLAQTAIESEAQKSLKGKQISFLYMPFMHSESKSIHKIAEKLFSEPEVLGNKEFELKHKAIIDKFGRYPHRNEILGRISTEQELEFLNQPNSSF